MNGSKGAAVFKKADSVVTRHIAGETVLVPVSGKVADLRRIFTLNSTGAYVWELLDGHRSVQSIREEVVRRHQVTPEQAETDVQALVDGLEASGLIEEVAPDVRG
jgi:hypothetical protein